MIASSNLSAVISVLLFGYHEYTLYILSAILYLMLFISAELFIGISSNFNIKNLIFGIILFMLPPSKDISSFFLTGGHTEIYIYILLAFSILFGYFKNKKNIFLYLFSLFVFLCTLSDNISILIFIFPVLICSFVSFKGIRNNKVFIATFLSAFFGKLLCYIINKFGYFTWIGLSTITIKYGDIPNSIGRAFLYLLRQYDADVFGINILSLNGIQSVAGFVIFLLAITNYIYLLWNYRTQSLINRAIIIGSSLQFLAYIFSSISIDGSERYLVPCTIYLNILLAENIQSIANFKGNNAFKRHEIFYLCIIALLVILSHVTQLPNKPGVLPQDRLAKVLEDHNLTQGYGGYWQSHSVTIAGAEHGIKVNPVTMYQTGKLRQFEWLSDGKEYNKTSNFIIIPSTGEINYGITEESVLNNIGKPDEKIVSDDFKIFVYYNRNLSAGLEKIE